MGRRKPSWKKATPLLLTAAVFVAKSLLELCLMIRYQQEM